jgi:caffeoyl-CoA O-methyltransferase
MEAVAHLDSTRPERYIKQLVSHLGTRLETKLIDPTHGRVEVPGGGWCVLTAGETGIELRAGADAPDPMAHIQDVVGRHLLRFTKSEDVTLDWTEA